MTMIQLRAVLRTPRRRVLLLLAVLILGSAVFYHHAEPTDMDGMVGGALCLAVLGGGTALVISGASRRWLPELRALPPLRPKSLVRPLTLRSVPARAGPLFLRLSVLRR